MNTKQRKLMLGLAGILILIAGVTIIASDIPEITLPDIHIPGFNLTIPINLNTGGGTDTATTQEPDPSPPPEHERTANSLAPTMLRVQVHPNPVQRNNAIGLAVLSDGYNTGVTIHALHLGADQHTTIPGLLAADGKFMHATVADIAGQWEIWAVSGDVISPRITVEVQGLHVVIEGEYALIVSHYHTYSEAHLWASHREYGGGPDFGAIPLTNGFARVYLDLNHPVWTSSPGVYDLDAQIGSVKASDTDSMGVVVIP